MYKSYQLISISVFISAFNKKSTSSLLTLSKLAVTFNGFNVNTFANYYVR